MTENRWDSNGPIRHAGPPVVPGKLTTTLPPAMDMEPIAAKEPRSVVVNRVLEIVRNLLAIVLLAALIVISFALIELGANFRERLAPERIAPDPAVTGCPFGEENCGG